MKLRSILTVLGIGIGIGAILFLVSLGQGLQRLLIQRITTAEALLTLDVSPAADGLVVLSPDSLKNIKTIEHIVEASPVKSEKTKISFDGVIAGATANFVDNSYFRLSGLDKFLDNQNQDQNKVGGEAFLENDNDIIVSSSILRLLSIADEAKGKEVDIRIIAEDGSVVIDKPFKIFQVINDETRSVIYFSLSAYPVEKLNSYNEVKIQVESTVFLESVRSALVQSGFIVSALSDTVRQANRVFSIMKIILGVFGIIALVVAAIGMFNTMTIALLERTQEIGIMRSIGASRRDIWLMFLFEGLIIGFFGGVSGVGIGIFTAEVANAGLNLLANKLGGNPLDIFYYPIWFIITVIAFSSIVALITSFYPARRAAHLNPLDALRYK